MVVVESVVVVADVTVFVVVVVLVTVLVVVVDVVVVRVMLDEVLVVLVVEHVPHMTGQKCRAASPKSPY